MQRVVELHLILIDHDVAIIYAGTRIRLLPLMKLLDVMTDKLLIEDRTIKVLTPPKPTP